MINKCQIGGRPFLSREFHQNVCIGRPLVDQSSNLSRECSSPLDSVSFLGLQQPLGLAADPPEGGGFSKLTEFCARMYVLCKQYTKWILQTIMQMGHKARRHPTVSKLDSKRHNTLFFFKTSLFNFSYIHIRDQMHYNIIIL